MRAAVLVLVLGLTLSGCTAAQTQQAVQTGRVVLVWVCGAAKKVCEAYASSTDFGVAACAAIETACAVGEPLLNSTVESAPAGDTEPHDLDAEP